MNQSDFETVESSLFYVDASSGVIDLLFRAFGHWGRYAVSYTAGYSTIPDDLAEAAAVLAAYLVNNPDGSNVGLSSKKEGQREAHYATASVSFNRILENLGINETLNAYANDAIFADK